MLTTAIALAAGVVWLFFAAMSDKEGRIKVVLAMQKVSEAQSATAAYYAERRALPPDNNALRLPNIESQPYLTAFEDKADLSFGIVVQGGTLTSTFGSDQDPISGKTLVFVPRIAEGRLEWSCGAGTVESRYRPPPCRSQ